MAGATHKAFDEPLVNYYEEKLVSQADALYRFCFALTLSVEDAKSCIRTAFQEVAAGLEDLRRQPAVNATKVMVGECWSAFQNLRETSGKKAQSPVVLALAPLTAEQRAALLAVDLVGLTATEAAEAYKLSEHDLRLHLSKGRKLLLENSKPLG